MRVFAVAAATALLTATLATAAPPTKRQDLANQGRKKLTRIAGTMTLIIWTIRVDGFIGATPNAKALGAKWSSKEPHWDNAHDVMIAKIMNRFDLMSGADQAHARMDIPFQSPLTEAEAAEVLALSPADRQQVDDWVDAIDLGVFAAEQNKNLKIGSPEWKDALQHLGKIAGVPTGMKNPPAAKLSATALDHYKQARSSGAEFLRVAVDGQLQLYFNDDLDTFMKIANDAALAAAQ